VTAARLPRALWVLLGLMLLTGLADLPRQVRFVEENLPVIRLWRDRESQQRRHLEPVPYDLLRAADALVPRSAAVLLVTPGEDVRHAEYVTFHRALYFLAPRPVWWLAPAPSDGTWEARWWISRPLTAESIRALATEKHASYVMAVAGSGLPELGATVAHVGDGRLLKLDGRDAGRDRPPPADAAAPAAAAVDVAGLALAAAALVTLWGVGAGALAAVGWTGYRVRRLEAAALAWPLGAALGSLAMLWMHGLGLTLGGQVAILGVLGLGGASWGVMFMCQPSRAGSTAIDGEVAPSHRAVRALLVGVIAVQVALVAVLAVGRPLTAWDGWAIWGLKARTIFLEGGVSPAVYADPSRASTHPYYPLLLPLTEAWVYGWLGTPDDRLVGLVSVLFYLSLVGISYSTVRRRADSPALGFGVAAVVGSIPN